MSSNFWDDRTGLRGKTAVIIGGGDGIGNAVSMALSGAGVRVFIGDVDKDSMATTIADIAASEGDAFGQFCDINDVKAIDGFFDWVAGQTSSIDILVNVAGGTCRANLEDGEPASDATEIQRNYGYVIQSVRRGAKLIRAGGKGGSIINFTTIEAHRGAAGFAVYAGAKAATTNFSRTMAVELGADRIRVNCIAPDTTPSQGNANALPPQVTEGMMRLKPEHIAKGLEMYVPMKEAPSQDALANGVLFLSSDMSAFVSGQTLHIDGGTWAASGFLDWPLGDGYLPVPLGGTLAAIYGKRDDI